MRTVYLSLALLLSGVSCAGAETLHFATVLSGKNEKAPHNVPATGTASVTLDTATKMATYRIEFTSLSGPTKMVHIHGLRSASGGAPEVIMMRMDHPTSPVTGSSPFTDAQITQLKHGDLYVNVHTDKYPDGEIRGWLVPASDQNVPLTQDFGQPASSR
jgi:hypothetical protein